MLTLAPFGAYWTPLGVPRGIVVELPDMEDINPMASVVKKKGREYVFMWTGKTFEIRELKERRKWWKEAYWWLVDTLTGKGK